MLSDLQETGRVAVIEPPRLQFRILTEPVDEINQFTDRSGAVNKRLVTAIRYRPIRLY
jgi:hypothetical protein